MLAHKSEDERIIYVEEITGGVVHIPFAAKTNDVTDGMGNILGYKLLIAFLEQILLDTYDKFDCLLNKKIILNIVPHRELYYRWNMTLLVNALLAFSTLLRYVNYLNFQNFA